MKTILIVMLSLFLLMPNAFADEIASDNQCHELLNFKATKLRTTEQIDFCEQFNGKALLIVNTASKCGFTPQFKGLEKLHQQYGDKLAVIGFPSDDFRQEHQDSDKVAEVCFVNYGVTFTMVEPSAVKGEDANAMFKSLNKITGKEPGWNFTKYLVSADGSRVEHFASKIKPSSRSLTSSIKLAL